LSAFIPSNICVAKFVAFCHTCGDLSTHPDTFAGSPLQPSFFEAQTDLTIS
jgi:hypothetical protein